MTKQIERGVSIERLRELFTYDPETGALTRKPGTRGYKQTNGRPLAASKAHTVYIEGEVKIGIHRVCFAMHNGRWPAHQVDHINRDHRDNRAANLREATPQQNLRNRAGWAKSGLPKGVRSVGKRYRARITINGSIHHIGMYDTPEQAGYAFVRAAAAHGYGEFLQVA